MISVYSNKEQLLKSTSTQRISRLQPVDTALLDVRYAAAELNTNKTSEPNTIKLEVHAYTPDGVYLTGNHESLFNVENNDTTSQKVAYQHISINTVKELDNLGIIRGQYRLVYNLFDNILGSFNTEKAFIKEISPSRKELRIQLSSVNLKSQLINLKNRWEELLRNDVFDSFVLNFGFNETYQIINIKFDINNATPEFFVKLYEPLPSKYIDKTKLWISEEIINPEIELISIIPKHVAEPVSTLAAPNFNLEIYDGNSIATDFKSWNDLLATNIPTSQQLIDAQFSGSLSGIKLNINYRDFSNFVQYSSATERVKNFKYKLDLIEHFTEQTNIISSAPTSSILNSSILDIQNKQNNIVSGFDDFEKYLFFGSSGEKLYTHFDSISGSIDPWPKQTSTNYTWLEAHEQWQSTKSPWNVTYFTNISPTTDSVSIAYYQDLLEQAEIYDKFNIHKLKDTIPTHIQNSEDSEQFLLFVNMMAQHFDIIWTYINNLTSTKTREEHPKDGMPDDLLYHVASSMGFNLLNGNSTSNLWKYTLGVDTDGNPLQNGENTNIKSLPNSSITKEIWRRIVNNLPYILKSKGTSRSIKALLTCFGIPSTVLTIKEYGGPSTFTDNDHFPEYEHEVYHKAWNANGLCTIQLPGNNLYNGYGTLVTPNTLEFRFKTDNNYQYDYGTNYLLVSGSGVSVYLSRQNNYNNLGKITYVDSSSNTAEINNLEIFDNSWHLITIDQTAGIATVKVTKSLYSKQIYINSGSCNVGYPLFSSGTPITLASTFKGHIHEIRLWSGSLHDDVLIQHASSPNTYTYNYDIDALATGAEAEAPYKHLLQRFTLSNNNFKDSNKFYSNHPNQTINNSGSAELGYITISDTNNFVLEGFEETYYTPSPSLGASSLYTNKVRIESSSLDVNKRLNTQTRIEKSSYDRYSLDSNRLGVYFSPQTQINNDIFNQLGYFEIDDYIGNPGDLYKENYTELTNFAIQYWKKYENRNDFEAYFRALQIYDFTLFKYIKQMLPQRTNTVVGLVVEPNVLERSRVRLNRKPTIEDLTNETVIAQFNLPLGMEYEDINGDLEYAKLSTNIDYDADKLGELQYAKISPNIDYDADKLAELQYAKLSPNIDYDADKLAILQEILLFPNIDYDADKLAALLLPLKFDESTIIDFIAGRIESLLKLTDSNIHKSKDGTIIDTMPKLTDSNIRKSKDGSIDTNPKLIDSNIDKFKNGIIIKTNPTLTDSNIHKSKDGIIIKTNPTLTDSAIDKFKNGIIINTSPKLTGNTAIILADTINSKIDTIDKLGTSWSQIRYIGIYKIQESGSYTPIQKIILQSRESKYSEITNYFYSSNDSASLNLSYSQSYSPSQKQESYAAGWNNARYNGCKITGTAININSRQTIDGGPVVKVTRVNPNKLVYSSGQLTTINESVLGIKKSIT